MKRCFSAEQSRMAGIELDVYRIRRIEPRANACAGERMATSWPYESATIPLGSKWDGPTPDDALDQGYLGPF